MASMEELIRLVQVTGLLTPAQTQDVLVGLGAKADGPDDFLQAGIRAGFLTKIQIEKLKNGDTGGYFFGDYKALYMVGAGTFARVFRAVHNETQQTAAVKVLRGRFSDNHEFIKHFLHEAHLGQQLAHPNIVPIYTANSEGATHFMVMEFVEGQTLREFVKIRKKVDAKTATQIIRDIADGLQYAAQRGLQHRDLKLSNVLLSATGTAKLVDFGLASIAEQANVSVPFLKNQQSIDYIALERTSGVPKNDGRSDLYFLGCMYYHLLSGSSPFLETKDRAKRLDRNRFFNIRPVQALESTIPRAVAEIVEKSMQVKPMLRYQTPVAMLADLERLLQQFASGAVPIVAHAKASTTPVAETENESGETTSETPARLDQQPAATCATLMIVESNAEMQDTLRTSFRKHGYRVLVIADAERAAARLRDDPTLADAVLFSATTLGIKAVRAFNEVGADHTRGTTPSILLLAAGQTSYAREAFTAPHRIVLTMPIKLRELREAFRTLLQDAP